MHPEVYGLSYCGSKQFLCASVKGNVSIIDISNKRLLRQINVSGHNNRVVSISADGNFIATEGSGNTVLVHSVETGKIIRKFVGHTAPIQSVKFSSDGKMLASIAMSSDDLLPLHLQISMRDLMPDNKENEDLAVRLWDIKTNRCRQLIGHTDEIHCISFSSDDCLLATGGFDKTIRIWDTNSSSCLRVLSEHNAPVTALVFASDIILISGSSDGKLRVWNVVTGACLRVLEKHTYAITSIVISADGTLMASGSQDDKIYLWRTSDYQCMDHLDGYGRVVYGGGMDLGVNALCFVEDKTIPPEKAMGEEKQNRFLAIGVKGSESIRLASITDTYFTENYVTDKKPNSIFKIMYFADEVITCDHHGMLARWNRASGKSNFRPLADYQPVMFINGGKSFVVIPNKQELRVLNAITLNTEATLILDKPHSNLSPSALSDCSPENPTLRASRPLISENGQYLVLVEKKEIHIWDIRSNIFLGTCIGHSADITAICFNPEITLIATGSNDDTIQLWDIQTQQCQKIFEMQDDHSDNQIYCINFSCDGTLLASGGDGGAIIWDVQSGSLIRGLKKNNESPIHCIHFSPDTSILACADFHNVYFEEVRSKECLEKQSCYRSLILDMKFSQDGSCLAVMTQNAVMMWKISRTTPTCSNIPYSHLATQLMWQSHPNLITDQVNFDGVTGLSALDEDLLALRHRTSKKTLIGALASGNLSSVIWFMRRQHYVPDDEIIGADQQGVEATALIKAIASGNLPLVKFLIHHGCSTETVTYHHTPLICAVMERQTEIAIYLLEAGANITKQSPRDGYTALHFALDRKLLTLIKILVARGAPLDVVAGNRATPLKLAAFIGEMPVIHALLEGLPSLDLKRKIIHELHREAFHCSNPFLGAQLRVIGSRLVRQNEDVSSNDLLGSAVAVASSRSEEEVWHALARSGLGALLLPRTQDANAEVQSSVSTDRSSIQTPAQAAQAVGHFASSRQAVSPQMLIPVVEPAAAQTENSRKPEPESATVPVSPAPAPEESKGWCSLI
jgi:WD40 repeat protein